MTPTGCHVNFARDPFLTLHGTHCGHTSMKIKLIVLYLHFLQPFTQYLRAILCLHTSWRKDVTNRCIRPLRSTAVVRTSVERFDTTNKDVCLPVTSLKDNTTRSIDDVYLFFFLFFFLFILFFFFFFCCCCFFFFCFFYIHRCTNLVGLK